MAIRFSPDGQQIAADVAWYLPGGSFVSNLVVVQTQRPNENIRRFDIHGIADDLNFSWLPVITWSPSSDAITVGRTIIRLGEGKTCELASNRGGAFIGADRIIVLAPARDEMKSLRLVEPTKFDIVDEQCGLRDSWEIDQDVTIDDISLDRGLLFASIESLTPGPREKLVIDTTTKATVGKFPGWGGHAQFANHGKAICWARITSGAFGSAEKLPLRCIDVDTGATIADTGTIQRGEPIFASEGATRIVAHDILTVRDPFSRGEFGTILKRRVLWDFQKDSEIASWGPRTQAYDLYLRTGPPARIKEMFRVALSPDGKYIVEGGNGSLRLYKIDP
jgi:hypothetical protein